MPREVRYRFGEFELDLNAYALTRAGRPQQLRRKAFDVLRFLIEHRERVVTKEELLDALWADSQVAEVAVPWTVFHVRRVLGQSNADKQPIETVYGRGYRFVAEVEVLSAYASEHPPARGQPSQAPAPASPFVGRQQAMALLHARLAEAKEGRGSLAALVGEAGIGKTRCLEEIAVRARDEGFALWGGRSTEETVAPVFWPWIQVLRDIARERPALREAAQGMLARLAACEASPEVTDVQLAQGSFWLFDGVSSLLRDAAREGPVLLLLEDLHWADLGSIQLLAFISPELHEHATLVVTTQRHVRDADRSRELRRLSRHAAARI
ncbi:MAG TPA: AAA family ATPase, partial [Polyangiaceae bacterium]|nr:AAA family ATPase [Polyangiaceae bacterium]